WALERYQGENSRHAYTDGSAIASSGAARDRRAGRDRAISFWRRFTGRISVPQRRLSRDVSRADPGEGKLRAKRRQTRRENSAGRRAHAFVLRLDVGRGHEQALSLSHAPPAHPSPEHGV